ncbi:MAG TPA: glutathione S-transferase family protein [Gammaproteobacteria bacterium]|jgi:glutathione S-transferase
MLKIWGRRNSVNVQKVLWCASELALPYERIDAGLQFGQNKEPWYLALNPNGRVPLMQDGALTLWESNSIVRYLCATHDHGGLYPAEPGRRAAAEKWMDWQLSTLARPVSIVFQNLVRTSPAERDLGAVGVCTAEANAGFSLLDRHLSTQRFVGGEEFSMGDIPVGAFAHRWLALDGVERPPWPALGRWLAELGARRGFRAHVMVPLS